MLQNHVTINSFKQLYSDHKLYNNGSILIAAYVDNLALTGPQDMQAIKETKEILHLAFNIKDLSEYQQLLRISINYELDKTLMISQQDYIEAMLQKFRLEQYKPISISIESSQKLLLALANNLYYS